MLKYPENLEIEIRKKPHYFDSQLFLFVLSDLFTKSRIFYFSSLEEVLSLSSNPGRGLFRPN